MSKTLLTTFLMLLGLAGCSEEPAYYFGGGSDKDRLYPVGEGRWISENGIEYYTARSERCDSLESLLRIIGSNLTAEGIQDVAVSKYQGLWMQYQGYNKRALRDKFDQDLQKWKQGIAAIGDSLEAERVARIVLRRLKNEPGHRPYYPYSYPCGPGWCTEDTLMAPEPKKGGFTRPMPYRPYPWGNGGIDIDGLTHRSDEIYSLSYSYEYPNDSTFAVVCSYSDGRTASKQYYRCSPENMAIVVGAMGMAPYYGALNTQARAEYDRAMKMVRQISREEALP